MFTHCQIKFCELCAVLYLKVFYFSLQPASKLKYFCDELKSANIHTAPLQLTLHCALELKKAGTYNYFLPVFQIRLFFPRYGSVC